MTINLKYGRKLILSLNMTEYRNESLSAFAVATDVRSTATTMVNLINIQNQLATFHKNMN